MPQRPLDSFNLNDTRTLAALYREKAALLEAINQMQTRHEAVQRRIDQFLAPLIPFGGRGPIPTTDADLPQDATPEMPRSTPEMPRSTPEHG